MSERFYILQKAGGPFIGPRGGLWADAKHTIPWKETTTKAPKKERLSDEESSALLEKIGNELFAAQSGIPGNLSKSFVYASSVSPMFSRWSHGGQVPAAIDKTFETTSHAMEMERVSRPILTVEGVVDGMPVNRGSWNPFLRDILAKGHDPITIRGAIFAKGKEQGLDRVLVKTLLQRALRFESDRLHKGEARGGSYTRRVAKAGGGYKYYYDENEFERKNPTGEGSAKAYVKSRLKRRMEKAGGSLGKDGVKDLVKRYGKKTVAACLKEDGYSYKNNKFTRLKDSTS